MNIFPYDSKIDFLRLRHAALAIAVLMVIGSLVLLGIRGLNYALDFTGGTVAELTFEHPADLDVLRDRLEAEGYPGAVVQAFGSETDVMVRLQPREGQDNITQTGDAVRTVLSSDDNQATLVRSDFVGPQVGKELAEDGIIAVVFVILTIMLYVAVRFEWRFGLAAIAGEAHDVIIALGFVSLMGISFDLTVLAGLLTVAGYSINDKVVVFDRVRELFRLTRKAETYDILNKSINQTLSRTIMTSLTTALAMFALYFFGGPSVHGFALTMLVGIVIGTLSSIFFANPILLWLHVSKADLMPVTKENPELARRP